MKGNHRWDTSRATTTWWAWIDYIRIGNAGQPLPSRRKIRLHRLTGEPTPTLIGEDRHYFSPEWADS